MYQVDPLKQLENNAVALHTLVAYYTCDISGCGRFDSQVHRDILNRGFRSFTYDEVVGARILLQEKGLVIHFGYHHATFKITADGMTLVKTLRHYVMDPQRKPVFNHLLPWFKEVAILAR
jgi:hypothetical protein